MYNRRKVKPDSDEKPALADSIYTSSRKTDILDIALALIGSMLICSIVFTYYNNTIIARNRQLQKDAENVKIHTELILRVLVHSADLSLRGYALTGNETFMKPLIGSFNQRDSIFNSVEQSLHANQFDLTEFHALKDSVYRYTDYCLYLKKMIDGGQREKFDALFKKDKGFQLWQQYEAFSAKIFAFEDQKNKEAEERYQAAVKNSYILQIALFLICFPTLLYTVYYTKKASRLSFMLIQSEAEKVRLLEKNNQHLEELVAQRTEEIANRNAEILAQNEELVQQQEEISAQRDALAFQNRELSEAREIIEKQNEEIYSENKRLEKLVGIRTKELKQSNQELVRQNHQLEQFAFMSSHNLRGPLSRILGLSHLLEISSEPQDRDFVFKNVINSSHELDQVIKDLSLILELKRHSAIITKVNLEQVLEKTKQVLKKEIHEAKAAIMYDFSQLNEIRGVQSYLESIFYHLLGNALKYRHPARLPLIRIHAIVDQGLVRISFADNGLGINLQNYGEKIFNMYERFHLHVEGRGLGLYLVKTQVIALGGEVDIESEPQQGTTITLTFHLPDQERIHPFPSDTAAG
jgi:signal transduction histidine kinase